MFSFIASLKSSDFLSNFFFGSWFTVQSEPLGCNLTQIDLRPSALKLGFENTFSLYTLICREETTIKKNRVNFC